MRQISSPKPISNAVRNELKRLQHATPHQDSLPLVPHKSLRSRQNIDRWLTIEAQAQAILLATETGWDISRVTLLAINLLAINLRSPEKRARLLTALAKKDSNNAKPNQPAA